MRRSRSIAFIAGVTLMVLVLSGCGNGSTPAPSSTATPTSGPVATPTPRVVEVEKEYRVLNPTGVFIPVETQALSPRLDSLNGKTIYVIQGEADPVIMPALAAELPHAYSNTTFEYYEPSSSFGPSSPDDTVVAEADGVILGIGW